MRLAINWSQSGNRISLDAEDHELRVAAKHIVEVCAARGSGPFEFRIARTPIMNKLFEDHLANMRFTLVEFKLADNEKIDYDVLVYRSKGVLFSPIVEEVTDGQGT